MRPAYLFAETAAKFQSQIELVKDSQRIDGKSVLSILTLGATKGTTLELEATGPDATDAVTTLADLMNSGFPEDPDTETGSKAESGSR